MNDFKGRINYSKCSNFIHLFTSPTENSLDNEDKSHNWLSHQFMVYTMSIIEISPLENNIHLAVSPYHEKSSHLAMVF